MTFSQAPQDEESDGSSNSADRVRKILARLKSRVRGQDEALQTLSFLLSMHQQRISKSPERSAGQRAVPNGILLGPTGVGKTYSIQTAADLFDVPFVVVDATSLVDAGIVGLQIEDILLDLVEAARGILQQKRAHSIGRVSSRASTEVALRTPGAKVGKLQPPRFVDDLRASLELTSGANMRTRKSTEDEAHQDTLAAIDLAQRGIIVLDEFDKLASDTSPNSNDIRRVQKRLLKLVEGASLSVGVRSHASVSHGYTIDTSGILILAAGAFQDISRTKAKRGHETARFKGAADGDVSSGDLVAYGLLPELVARLPVMVKFQELPADALAEILRDPENGPLSIWHEYLVDAGMTLMLTDKGVNAAVDYARALKLGARGLAQVLFPVLATRTFEAIESGADSVVIDDSEFLAYPELAR
jgi:ATP-dependent protease Clp ATPase subunit